MGDQTRSDSPAPVQSAKVANCDLCGEARGRLRQIGFGVNDPVGRSKDVKASGDK